MHVFNVHGCFRVAKQRIREARLQAVDFLLLLIAGISLGTLAKVSDENFGAVGYTYTIIAFCKFHNSMSLLSRDKNLDIFNITANFYNVSQMNATFPAKIQSRINYYPSYNILMTLFLYSIFLSFVALKNIINF